MFFPICFDEKVKNSPKSHFSRLLCRSGLEGSNDRCDNGKFTEKLQSDQEQDREEFLKRDVACNTCIQCNMDATATSREYKKADQ